MCVNIGGDGATSDRTEALEYARQLRFADMQRQVTDEKRRFVIRHTFVLCIFLDGLELDVHIV